MSTTDGDASSRLESALADVFSGAPTLPSRDSEASSKPLQTPPPAGDDDWDIEDPDDRDDAPLELPEIVPATAEPAPPMRASPPAAPVASPAAPAPARATSWGDHMTNLPASAQGAGLRAPGRRPRVRRVTRVLRHIDPWSTFKVALLFSAVAYLVTLTSGVLLWRVADSTGTLDNVERWFTQFGWETFELKGGEIFHDAWIIGLFGAVAMTGGLVLLATLFNLVSDIVGGVRMTVLEEEVVERTVSSTRRYVVRRAPVTETGTADDWGVDDEATAESGASTSGSSSLGPVPSGAATRAATAPTTGPTAAPSQEWSIDDDDGDLDDDPGDGAARR